jgi:DnaJ-class molecular chaperone
MSTYERCPICKGSGLSDQGAWIGDCTNCDGEGVVRVRDARGRFAKAGGA